MAPFFRLLPVPTLLGALLWSGSALAQTGDVIDDESQKGDESSGSEESDEQSDEGSDDEGDGGWEAESSGSSSGAHFGLRLAYGIPFGNVSGLKVIDPNDPTGPGKDDKLSDALLGQIPIWLDVGWQATPSFMVGVYFSYGFGLLTSDQRDNCDARKISCRVADIRLGLQVQYGFSPGRGTNPWIGAGVGYEWLTGKFGDNTATVRGWELPMIQGGVDFGGDTAGSTFGPFVAFSRGKYDHFKNQNGQREESGTIDDTADHYWLFLGIRGVVN